MKVRVTVVTLRHTGPTTTVSPDSSTPFRFDVAPVPWASTFIRTAEGRAGVGVGLGAGVGVPVNVGVGLGVDVRVGVDVAVGVFVGV